MAEVRNSIIIGSGPAGLTAAIYNARANLKPLVFAGLNFGGQLMTTTDVENYPGFPEGVKGPQLMQLMLKQAQRFGAEIKFENVQKVDFSGEIKKVYSNNIEYQARTVIISTGSSSRTLGVPGEDKFFGKGVSTCATCDGAFFKAKVVAVVGGGDTAMEDATFLTRFASKVYIIHRRDEFRASKIMQERALNNPKIEVVWNTEVKEIQGEQQVTGLKIFNNKDNKESVHKLDGVFLAVGHIPNTSYLGKAVELDEKGYIKVYEQTKTSVDGVFVAGDVKDYRYMQAVTAAGMGCMAAIDCEKWLEEHNL